MTTIIADLSGSVEDLREDLDCNEVELSDAMASIDETEDADAFKDESVESLGKLQDALEQFVDILKCATDKDGNVPPSTLASVSHGIESLTEAAGLSHVDSFGIEDGDSKPDTMIGKVKAFIVKIWKAIVAAVSFMFNKMAEFIKRIQYWSPLVKRKIAQLKEKAKALPKSSKDDLEMQVTPAKALSIFMSNQQNGRKTSVKAAANSCAAALKGITDFNKEDSHLADVFKNILSKDNIDIDDIKSVVEELSKVPGKNEGSIASLIAATSKSAANDIFSRFGRNIEFIKTTILPGEVVIVIVANGKQDKLSHPLLDTSTLNMRTDKRVSYFAAKLQGREEAMLKEDTIKTKLGQLSGSDSITILVDNTAALIQTLDILDKCVSDSLSIVKGRQELIKKYKELSDKVVSSLNNRNLEHKSIQVDKGPKVYGFDEISMIFKGWSSASGKYSNLVITTVLGQTIKHILSVTSDMIEFREKQSSPAADAVTA